MQLHDTYDIIVIGAGAGGLTSAIFMQKAGFKVLLIDRRPDTFGGDCLNYGCIPSKSLLHVAHLIHSGAQASAFRSQSDGKVDIQKVMSYVHKTQNHIRAHENPEYLKSLGIDIAIGEASFTGRRTIAVANTSYSAKKIIVATGSRPRTLELDGIEGMSTYTNETIFAIQSLPNNFVFIGGGPINIELGQAFRRLGSHVTIVQSSSRILDKEDPEVSTLMQRVLEDEGIEVLCDASLERVEDHALVVRVKGQATRSIPADALFIGIGRIPNVETLRLENAGIRFHAKRMPILDDYLRTSNKRIAIIGDAAGQHMFTHAAELQAALVLKNMFSPIKRKYSSKYMAWTTFSDPEIATFGANKAMLVSATSKHKTISVSLENDDRAITENATKGFLTIHVSKSGRLLGGVMVGNHAGEVVSELILMMIHKIKITDILGKTFPYPVASRVIQAAARQYSSKQLDSARVRWLLRVLYH